MDKNKNRKIQDQKKKTEKKNQTLEQTYNLVVWILFCALSATKWEGGRKSKQNVKKAKRFSAK